MAHNLVVRKQIVCGVEVGTVTIPKQPLVQREEECLDRCVANNNENERYFVQNREIFCHLRVGVLDSLIGKDYIAKKLKVSATARNWRTVNKVLEF